MLNKSNPSENSLTAGEASIYVPDLRLTSAVSLIDDLVSPIYSPVLVLFR